MKRLPPKRRSRSIGRSSPIRTSPPEAADYLDDIIDPRDTRPVLIAALESLQTKRDKNPAEETR